VNARSAGALAVPERAPDDYAMDTVRSLQRRVADPLVRLAFRAGVPDPGDALLETTGRHTARPRLTPVCDGLSGDTFWLLAQRRDADWVRNLEANPRVRVQTNSGPSAAWRTGTAHILEHDDPVARQRILERNHPWLRLCLRASGALASDALTIRIDLDPDSP
jgi:deazaflavin-dependent oxidoreductase (nitroreductase family)